MPPTSGDIPTRQNNPGDLKVGGSIATYKDPQEGYAALLNDLYAKQTGKTSTGLKPTSTLSDFSTKYAPASDGNDPAQYTANLANQMGVAPDTQLKDLDLGKWADAVAKNEGYVSGGHGTPASAPTANLASATVAPPSGGYSPPAAPGQTAPAQPAGSTGYAPPTPPPAPVQTTTAPTPGSDPSGGFLSGLQEDLSGSNPDSLGTQLANTVKGAGNSLFPILGDLGNDVSGSNKKTALQQAGDLGLSALPFIPGLGEAGEVLRGADAGAEGVADVAKSGILKKALGSTAAKGAGTGYGAGVLSNLSNGQGIAQALTPNSTNVTSALTGGVAGVALPKIAGALSKSEGNPNIQRIIQDMMPQENKATRMEAFDNNNLTRKGILGKSAITQTPEDIARGEAAAPYIGNAKDPIEQNKRLAAGIADISNKTDSFLDANAAPANFADMRDYMETNRPSSTLKNDPVASENYNRATQDALDTLASVMKNTQEETGNFGPQTSGADIRHARIAIDQQMKAELGKNVFGTPQYIGIKAAEMDSRNLLNRMSEDMLRYPGQMENLNKMNRFVSDAKGRGISVDMNNSEVRSQLENSFKLTTSPEDEAKANALSNAHKKMSYLYEAKENVRNKYQSKIGKNKIQEAVDSNPIVKTAANIGARAIPFGLADHLVK